MTTVQQESTKKPNWSFTVKVGGNCFLYFPNVCSFMFVLSYNEAKIMRIASLFHLVDFKGSELFYLISLVDAKAANTSARVFMLSLIAWLIAFWINVVTRFYVFPWSKHVYDVLKQGFWKHHLLRLSYQINWSIPRAMCEWQQAWQFLSFRILGLLPSSGVSF